MSYQWKTQTLHLELTSLCTNSSTG